MNKDILYWVICLILTGIFFNLLTGCANTQMAEQNRLETEYRKQTAEYVEREKARNASKAKNTTGPIEMPQEWLDQWPAQGEAE
jgi:hypothetical protein